MSESKVSVQKQKEFIIEYLGKNPGTNVSDSIFHEEFFERFGGKRKETFFGAMPVYKAQRLLSTMYKNGEISRGIVNFPERWYGQPSWVYDYYIYKK